ncbi:hypothetical protein FF1_047251 [Malus domestica]
MCRWMDHGGGKVTLYFTKFANSAPISFQEQEEQEQEEEAADSVVSLSLDVSTRTPRMVPEICCPLSMSYLKIA